MGRTQSTCASLSSQIGEVLGLARDLQIAHPGIKSHRIVIGHLGEGVIAGEVQSVRIPLLKPKLEGVIAGSGDELRESSETTIKLGKRAQQVEPRDLLVIIDGIRLIEDCIGALKEGPEWIIHQLLQ